MSGDRLKRGTLILFPVLLALYLFRRSFRIWFLADDFAWLGLSLSIHSPADLWSALFAPMAQGTVRTLSERLFFLIFERSFGLESLPMRLWAFATFAAGLVLMVLVVQRLSGCIRAGSLAAVLWSLNFGVSIAMSWLSSYNQILLSTLILGAMYCFFRYVDGGGSRWLAGAWLCYLLGFGALESVIVLPGILLVWAWCFHRSAIKAVLPLFGPAVLFAIAHLFLIFKAKDASAYRMYFDASLLESISIYWEWMLGSLRLIQFDPAFGWMLTLSRWVVTPSVLGFIAFKTWKKDWLPLFGLLMSAALLAPMLPLRDHRTDYYLASASMGLMMVMALMPFRLPGWAGKASLAVIALYAIPSFIIQQASIEWYLERTAPIRPLMRGLLHGIQTHPGKLILLEGISDDVYNSSLGDSALRLLPAGEIRLAPGNGPSGNPLTIQDSTIRTAFEKQTIIVYRFDNVRLKDVTREWERGRALTLGVGLSPEVLAGDLAFAPQFVSGWHSPEGANRWMTSRAVLRLGGPFQPGARLRLSGYATTELGQFELSFRAQGISFRSGPLNAGPIDLDLPLPEALRSQPVLLLELESSRSVKPPGDGRELSILLSKVSIR